VWSEKHRPKRLEEMVGNEEGRAKLLLWLKRWKKGARAALLVGPPGTGKTTTVHLAAEKLGIQLVELNASDARTKEKMSRRIGELVGSTNLFGERSLIFLDEVDGLAGRSDYGAIDFIKEAVRKSHNPVVMAANDPDSDEVRKLSSVITRIEFRRVPADVLAGHLEKVARDEGARVGREELVSMAEAANGDIRSAINFLQSGGSAVKDEEVSAGRAIDAFFGSTNEKSALRALRDYPGEPRQKVRDLFVSVVKSRVHESRKSEALDVLSRADVIMGRIMRGKNWRLLRYLDQTLASELWKALGDGGARFSLDSVPWPLQLRIWNDSKKLKELGRLSGRRLGISQRGWMTEDMPYVMLLAREKSFRDGLTRSLGLEEGYGEFLAREAARAGRG
jgi:replication factor C large subunit